LGPGAANDGLHFRVLLLVVRSFDEDQPVLVPARRQLELPLRGRDALGVLETVLVAEAMHHYTSKAANELAAGGAGLGAPVSFAEVLGAPEPDR